jgi:hypothetical protein
VSTLIKQNVARNQRTGLNLTTSWEVTRQLKLNGGGEFYHARFRSPSLGISNKGWLWQINLNLAYQVRPNYTVQAFGFYSTGWILLQGKNSAWYNYGIAGRKDLWNKKASITLGVDNPFSHPFKQTSRSSSDSFQSMNNNYWYTRAFKLSFSWQFGQIQSGAHDKNGTKITNDDTRNKE